MAVEPVKGPIAVAPGYKFSVLAIAGSRAGPAPSSLISYSSGLAVSTGLPSEALTSWGEDIGRLHQDELAETNLFLWSLRRSNAPAILDEENEQLIKDVLRFYLGLLIATPYFSHARMTCLTGANSDGHAGVRSIRLFAQSYYTIGAPYPYLSVGRLNFAESLARSLRVHDEDPGKTRIERALRAFREGCESRQLDYRLHQFVRCAEGFAVPPFRRSAVHFGKRLSRVCAGRSQQRVKQMYDLRSGIEHLHGPYDRMPRRLSKRDQHVRLLQRCVEAETLARYLLATYFSNPQLWPHFRTKTDIDSFWALRDSEFRRKWPNKLKLDHVLRDFDYAALEDIDD
jgi:hypothetical protein